MEVRANLWMDQPILGLIHKNQEDPPLDLQSEEDPPLDLSFDEDPPPALTYG